MVRSTVERHPRRGLIIDALRAGRTNRDVAREFRVPPRTLDRFAAKLRATDAAEAAKPRTPTPEEARTAEVKVLNDQLRGMLVILNRFLRDCTMDPDSGQPRVVPRVDNRTLKAIKEVKDLVMATAKLQGLLQPDAAVAVQVNVAEVERNRVDLRELRDVILTALLPHPEARQSVAAALVRYDNQKAGVSQS